LIDALKIGEKKEIKRERLNKGEDE